MHPYPTHTRSRNHRAVALAFREPPEKSSIACRWLDGLYADKLYINPDPGCLAIGTRLIGTRRFLSSMNVGFSAPRSCGALRAVSSEKPRPDGVTEHTREE